MTVNDLEGDRRSFLLFETFIKVTLAVECYVKFTPVKYAPSSAGIFGLMLISSIIKNNDLLKVGRI